MAWAEGESAARGLPQVRVQVRIALRGNLAFYGRLGYEVVSQHSHPGYGRPTFYTMRKRV
jgi:hypothetical protein